MSVFVLTVLWIEESINSCLDDSNIEKIFFYNLVADPMEMNNLADLEADSPVFLNLKKKLLKWNRNTVCFKDDSENVADWRL